MAIRAILLRKKIADQKKELDALKAKTSEFESRKADLEKREAETTSAIEEAETEEEKAAVEESVSAIEADQAQLDADVSDNDAKIADLEKEVDEMERELFDLEENQTRTVPPIPDAEKAPEEKTTKKTKKGGSRSMFRCKNLRAMTIVEREELINRDDVQAFLKEVREAIANKRGLVNGAYTIPTTIAGFIRENVIEYSKLYKHCRVYRLSGNGRVVVMGAAPEAFWEECCDPIYELEQTLSKVELDCYKVAGFFPMCNALLEDSDIDLFDEIVISLSQAIGTALDKAILYGTGVKMPTGVATAIDDDETLKVSNEVTISTSDSVGVKLFQKLVLAGSKANNNYARGEKVWVMNDATYTTLMAEGLSVNAAGAIVTGVNGTMPVGGGVIEVLNFVAANNIVAGYFDLYCLGERKEITIDVSEHVRFIQDQTVFRGRARYDGKPAIVKAFVLIGINNTSPATSAVFPDPSQS